MSLTLHVQADRQFRALPAQPKDLRSSKVRSDTGMRIPLDNPGRRYESFVLAIRAVANDGLLIGGRARLEVTAGT